MRLLASGPASDTIFALASGVGRSAIAVIRVSGPACGSILESLCADLPAPRTASLRRIRDARDATLDRAIVLWMPGPNSYTGEDSAELHVHGGRAVLDGVAGALVEAGARPGDPGEFTRRAVLNGKLDLLKAEAVGDLIDAGTDLQRRAALLQLSGTQSRMVEHWAETLKHLLAHQEALIDFAEDEVPAETERSLETGIRRLNSELSDQLRDVFRGERLREGLLFVIAGPPNAGKSSLLNALAGRDAAIVSPLPGTTRDAVQVHIELGGVPVTLVDTAGLRDTLDFVEAEGVRRTRQYAERADLVIWLSDTDAEVPEGFEAAQTLFVKSKTDVRPAPPGSVGVNVVACLGLDELLWHLTQKAAEMTHSGSQPAFSRARHAAAFRDAQLGLQAALLSNQPEIRAEELRLALRALGRLVGSTDVEAVLDSVFSSFCIGK